MSLSGGRVSTHNVRRCRNDLNAFRNIFLMRIDMTCQLVTTGWYASAQARSYKTFGDETIRGPEFRRLWWQSLQTFVKPEHVFVVDSASPVKSDDVALASMYATDLRGVELLINPGHSQNTTHHYCGAMAAIILGMEYALYSGVDYYMYIEQDALIYGDGFIRSVEKSLSKNGIVFGGAPGRMTEHTIMAFDRKVLRKFLSDIHAIGLSDRLLEPEYKFMHAASLMRYLPVLSLLSYKRPRWIRHPVAQLSIKLAHLFRQYEIFPFGYGRLRPINFEDEIFYFQHGSLAELSEYRKKTGFV